MNEVVDFMKMQENLDQRKEALDLGIQENEIETFMSYSEEDRENVLARLRYMKDTGKSRL